MFKLHPTDQWDSSIRFLQEAVHLNTNQKGALDWGNLMPGLLIGIPDNAH
jgi:hypothetical protein